MNITSLRWRRLLTTLGVVAALALGFGSIRVRGRLDGRVRADSVAPIPVGSIQDRLDQELARSEAMRTQLDALAATSAAMTTALDAAQARIAADAGQPRRWPTSSRSRSRSWPASRRRSRRRRRPRPIGFAAERGVGDRTRRRDHGDDDGEIDD